MASTTAFPLMYQQDVVGRLLVAPRVGEEDLALSDRRLLDDLARQAGVAAHALQLHARALQLAAELQRSRVRLVTAGEEERHRHDGIGPTLASLTHRLDRAADLERSAAWYTSVLGFQQTTELQGEGWRKAIFMQPQSRLVLGLTAHDTGSQDRFEETRTGMDHVAFQVPNRTELNAWKARFEQLGVAHSPIKESAMGWLIVFRDPDNIQLEVYAHGK